MRKVLLITFSLVIFLNIKANCQKQFKEGEITYAAEWDLPSSIPSSISESLPKEIVMSVKNSNSFVPMEIKIMGQSMTMNVYSKSNPIMMATCMKVMGRKMGFIMDETDYNNLMDTLKVEYEYLDFKKEIAGYLCKKVIVKMNGTTSEVFVTDELNLPNSQYTMTYKGLKGTPLEFKQDINGMKVRMKAISFNEKPIDDSLFEIPSDYKLTPLKDVKKSGIGY